MASPTDSVFTTLRWDGADGVAFRSLHLNRIREHAHRLGIAWPEDFEQRLADSAKSADKRMQDDGNGLARIRLDSDGLVSVEFRWVSYPDSPLKAASHPAPRWKNDVLGSKHGDWSPYDEARDAAQNKGADLALLVHDGAVVDGDRCTPLLLDADGVAHISESSGGGVDSVTLAVLLPALVEAGIPLNHSRLTETMLGRAREVVVVGSGCGVAWLSEIDGQPIGAGTPGPLHNALSTALDGELEKGFSPLVGGES